MKIRYKKKHLKINLIFGIIWLVYGIILVTLIENSHWINYGWFIISAMYLGLYFYQRNEKYLSIENGIIKVNWPFGKEINITEIKRIKRFAGNYIIKTDKSELTINTLIIDPKSLEELNTELEKLDAEWI